MADTDLKDIFEQAAGSPDPADALKHDDKDLKDIFKEAHDSDPIEQAAASQSKPEENVSVPGGLGPNISINPTDLKNYATVAAKGLTGGLTGAAAGAGAAAGTFAGGKRDWESLKAAYQEALQAQKDKEKSAEEQTGLPGMATEFAAGIPTMMVGGSALKGAGLTNKLAQGAALGGGLGLSNYVGQTASPTASGAALNTGIGAGLGTAGTAIGNKLSGLLNPEDLETASSKLAQEAMGMNSAKDLTTQYNPTTEQVEQGSDIIRGTGTTALEQGVLKGGPGKWFDNALQSLNKNYTALGDALQSTQEKLDANLPQVMDGVGPITTKTPDVMQNIFDSIPQNSQKNSIIRKITQQYQQYEQKLGQADGNLPALNAIKQELTTAAENISPQVYTSGTAKTEADLYKRLAGVVRQHIEDLASAADPGAGDEIHNINKNIGNLTSTIPSLKQLTRGGIPKSKAGLVQKVTGPVEAAGAKALNWTVNAIKTPVGELVQNAVQEGPKTTLANPFSQDAIQSHYTSNTSTPEATKTSASLYNANDESLQNVASKFKQVPGLEFYGEHLNKAITNDDQQEKNRAIFLILQNPKARALVQPNGKQNE